MADVTCIDYRRTDLRKNVLENPYWITSGEMVVPAAEDLASILFSFPNAGRVVVVHEVLFQVTTLVAVDAGAALCTVGLGTIATDIITTGGVVTTVDVDDFIVTADVTFGTVGYYAPVTGCDFITAKAAGTMSGPILIVGAATAVPVVAAYWSNAGGTFTAGKARVHMLVSEVPGK